MSARWQAIRPWYMIGVMTLVSIVGYIDRQIVNLLVEPIKADFKVSDTQISLLQGLAFMTAYVAISPLFGRWVDKGNRRNILIFQVVVWSAFTAMCGLVRNYTQLFVARVGVGAAEAGLVPATWSIIGDSFDADRLPRAFSIYLMAPYLGGGLAMVAGGMLLRAAEGWRAYSLPLVGALAPWQLVFVAVGIPGMIMGAVLLTVREPSRGGVPAPQAMEHPASTEPTLAEVFTTLWRQRAFYLNFYLGMACIISVLYAMPAWVPSLLVRRFGMTPADVGLDYGILLLISGSAGVLMGPLVGRALSRSGRADSLVQVATIAAVGLIGCGVALFFVDSYLLTLAVATVAGLFYSLPQAMSASAIQLVTPNRMRGMASSLYILTITVIGLGVGPTAVAMITDYVFGDPARVGESLAIVTMASAVSGAWLLWRGAEGFRQCYQSNASPSPQSALRNSGAVA